MSLVPTSCPGSLISSEDEGTWEGVDLVPMILGFRRSVKSFLTWRRKRWGTSSHNIEIRRYLVEKHVCVWFTGKGNSCSSSDQSARHPSAICVHIWVDFVVGTRLVPGVFIWVLWYSKFQYVRPGYVASSLNILIYFCNIFCHYLFAITISDFYFKNYIFGIFIYLLHQLCNL